MRNVVKISELCLLFIILSLVNLRILVAPDLPEKAYDAASSVYTDLIDRLIQEGHDAAYIKRLYAPGNDIFYQRLTDVNLIQRERPDPYKRMFNPSSVHAIRNYLKAHTPEFDAAEEQYGVDRKVIAAILFVESRFGSAAGDNLVLYVLSSMTLSTEDWNMKHLIEEVDRQFPDLSPAERQEKIAWVESRARRKSEWAYQELNTLLTFRHSRGMQPEGIKGSWAGAFGIPQFMPSSFEAYAVDGNDDSEVNIYTAADAIASVANYLYRNGWRGTLTRKKIRRTIWRYNHSYYYVDLIEKLANAV